MYFVGELFDFENVMISLEVIPIFVYFRSVRILLESCLTWKYHDHFLGETILTHLRAIFSFVFVCHGFDSLLQLNVAYAGENVVHCYLSQDIDIWVVELDEKWERIIAGGVRYYLSE